MKKLESFESENLPLELIVGGNKVVATTYVDCDGNSGGDTWDGYELIKGVPC